MTKVTISQIKARQIIDSRGNPTVEADLTLSDGSFGRAAVPSGASTGSEEALELRDQTEHWMGKSVFTAIKSVNEVIAPRLIGQTITDQNQIDQLMIDLDGTADKSSLGANAILSISLAYAKAIADHHQLPLYKHISQIADTKMSLPLPMMNVMNGGAHAAGSSDIQEYMIMPIAARNFTEVMQISTEIFHHLGKILADRSYATTVGDEGGYAPRLQFGNQEPLELIKAATEAAGYNFGRDVVLALDVAASEFYRDERYHLQTEDRTLTATEIINLYAEWISKFPIISIEDGLAENDWANWQELTSKLGAKIQLVGDDLLVTNPKRLQHAIDKQACNAILIKPNQIGTLTETIETAKLAKANGFKTVMSHRSGETEDTTIAHLAVGLGTGQIKTGSLSRTDRVCKYNELLRIAEMEPSLKLTTEIKI